MRIVLANATVAQYPDGGGHWNWFLQYPLGLRDLGHDVYWLEVMRASEDPARDAARIKALLERTARYGLSDRVIALRAPTTPLGNLAEAEIYGATRDRLRQLVGEADLLWNFWYGLKAPLLDEFRRTAFIDVDPGHLQVCAAGYPELDIGEHDSYLTVGLNINEPDCGVPTLGRQWHSFRPFVYLPACEFTPDPGPQAPFTSVTHWTWEFLQWRGRSLSISKRAAYRRYLELPQFSERPFELAADLPPADAADFRQHGWRLVRPAEVAATPEQYRDYIRRSRAEFMCPKPIHLELRSGWFSDRSVVYLAAGRPVLAEDTGFTTKLPHGRGLVAFAALDEARAAVAEIDRDYGRHQAAARELACDLFDSRRCLPQMIAACG